MRYTSLFLWTNSEPSGKLQPQSILGKNALSSWAFLKISNSPLPNSRFTSRLWSVRISINSSLFPHRANVLIPSSFTENTAPWCRLSFLETQEREWPQMCLPGSGTTFCGYFISEKDLGQKRVDGTSSGHCLPKFLRAWTYVFYHQKNFRRTLDIL